jgi:hypothetical protein
MSDPTPAESLCKLLREAVEDRRQTEERRRERQERLRPFLELRPRWEQAWAAVRLWPGEQRQRGRKPDP